MLKLGSWLFDDTSRRLLRGSRERKVSPKAADVLRALAETPGQVWSRDALLERGWPGVVVGEEVLTHAIAELRKALDDDPRTPRYIETIHKAGYRLLASVAQLSTPAATCAEGLTLLDDAADFEIDAYGFYLSGIWLWEHDDARAAADMFASALRLSPNFALAHAGMAKALADAATYQEPHADERRRLLERALDHSRAAKFGGITAQAVAAEAFVFAMTGHARRAKAGYAAAIRMAPNDAETHRLKFLRW